MAQSHGIGWRIDSLPQGLSVAPRVSTCHGRWLPLEQDEGGIGEEKGRQSRSCSVFMNSCTPSLPHCPVGHPVMLRRRQRGRGQNIGRGGPLRPVWERAAPQPWKVSFHLTVHLPFPVRGRYVRQRLSLVFSLKGQISHKA